MIERTLVLVKPDGVQRGLIGKIITRFEDVGLKIIAMKMVWADETLAAKHYFDVKERYDERIFNNLSQYLREGPVVAMVLEGIHAVKQVRKMTGSTYPDESTPGTIRGDFAHISKAYANENNRRVGNLLHSSAKLEEAKYEIGIWFNDKEIHAYKTVHEDNVR
ncbi:MAG: nucleoside-diphosphate kinase [Candidatus Woesearchaeota archaeon]|jgi:nucleoside-diphosphate kinase